VDCFLSSLGGGVGKVKEQTNLQALNQLRELNLCGGNVVMQELKNINWATATYSDTIGLKTCIEGFLNDLISIQEALKEAEKSKGSICL
jgi:hypothetical protein